MPAYGVINLPGYKGWVIPGTNQILRYKKVWFIGEDLYSLRTYDDKGHPGTGMIELFNWRKDKMVTMLTSEFKRVRKKAYTIFDIAELLNYSVKTLRFLQDKKIIPRGITRQAEWLPRGSGKPTYFTEEMVYEIRDIIAARDYGGKRIKKAKLPSESQLSAKLNKASVTYTQNPDGTFVPNFPETI